MAKKVLYKRMLESQRSYWPATFEDISDDERNDFISSPVVADYYHYAIDFSTKKEDLSPVSYLAPAMELNCVGAFPDPRVKEVPINLKIKQESIDLDEEGDLVIDTNTGEDERLLQDWNEDSDLSIDDEKKDDMQDNSIVIAPQEMTTMKLEPQYDASTYCQTQSIEQFNCSFCTRKYWKFSKLKDHINSHHFGKKSAKKNHLTKTVNHYDDKRNLVSKCPDCKKQLQTKTDMYVHRLTHRNPSFAPIPCMLCKENQLTYGALKTHMREKHGINEKWFCPICPDVRTFTQNHSLLIHISTFHFDANKQPPAQYPCRKCPRTFTSKGLLGKHLGYAHFSSSYKLKQYKMFKCESCKDFFEDFEALEKHSPCFEEKKNSDNSSPFGIPRQNKCSTDFLSSKC